MGNKLSQVSPLHNECIICLGILTPENHNKPCLDCNMFYHNECIKEWFTNRQECPVCHRSDRLVDFQTKKEFCCMPLFSGIVVPD